MKYSPHTTQRGAAAIIKLTIGKIDRWVAKMRIRRSTYIAIRQLGTEGTFATKKILFALASMRNGLRASDAANIDKIERERLRLSQDRSPLDDGTLSMAGMYDADATISDACAVSKPSRPALLLYLLIRAFKPKSVIELGTNVGLSSSFIGMALKDNDDEGKLTTLDASPYRMRQAREVHDNLSLNNIAYVEGLFTDTLKPTLLRCPAVDFAFIDGHHQLQPTLDYFEEIVAFSVPGAIFVFDDIRWSEGMKQAWRTLSKDERFSLVLDLSSMGLCVLRGPDDSGRLVTRRLEAW